MIKRLNLLPKAKQEELHYEQLFHSVSVALSLAVAILLAGIVAQLLVWTYFDRTQVGMAHEIEALKEATDKTENAELKKQIRVVNNQVDDFANLLTKTPQWSVVLDAFAAQVPSGMLINRFDADTAKLKVDIAGFSPTREQVIELYNNINADKVNFKDIDYPLENVASPLNVQFKFTFFVQDGVLVPEGEQHE